MHGDQQDADSHVKKDNAIKADSEQVEEVAQESPRDKAKRLSAQSGLWLPEPITVDTYQGLEVAPIEDDHTKEVVWDYSGKQLGGPHTYPEAYNVAGKESVLPYDEKERTPHVAEPTERILRRRFCGVRLIWLLLGLLLVLIVGAALGAGLGVGLARSKPNSHQSSGVLRYSKFALARQTFPNDDSGSGEVDLVIYFQHESGSIRWMRLHDNGTWTGGDESTNVALNAKAGTPISAVWYTWTGNNFWRVYYIDNTNIIRETWASNYTQGWATGPLSYMSLSPLDDDHVGMTVCWYGASTSGGDTLGNAESANATDLLIRLVYAVDDTTFQIMHSQGEPQEWVNEQNLTGLNGHASPACFDGDSRTLDYIMFVDASDAVNVFWKDFDTNRTNSTTHPLNIWTNSSISIPSIHPSTTLSYTSALYAQDASTLQIKGYNITFAAENTTLSSSGDTVVGNLPGIAGTGIGTVDQFDYEGGRDVLVFFQTDEGGIAEYRRPSGGGAWTRTDVVLPRE